MSLLYYNCDIKVYRRVEAEETDEYGVAIYEDILVATVPAAVHPASSKRAREDYGITTNVTFEIITDPNPEIYEGILIEYKGIKYKVVSLLDWSNGLLPCYEFVVAKVY